MSITITTISNWKAGDSQQRQDRLDAVSDVINALAGQVEGTTMLLAAPGSLRLVKGGAAPAPSIALSVTLPSGTVGVPYSGQAVATNQNGATGAITYSAVGLPAGLTIDSATGDVTGIPTTPQSATPTVTASNGTQQATQYVPVTIIDAPHVGITKSLNQGKVGVAYSGSVTGVNVAGATGAITYSVDTLPAGLSLDTSTGDVTGDPTTDTGTTPVTSTFTATNGVQSASVQHAWNIAAAGSSGVEIIGTKVAGVDDYSSSLVVSTGLDVQADDLVVVQIENDTQDTAELPVLTDASGNVWTPTDSILGADGRTNRLCAYFTKAKAAASGYSVTVGFTRTVNGIRACVSVLRGSTAWSLDAASVQKTAQTYTDSAAPFGPFTTTGAGVAFVSASNANWVTGGSITMSSPNYIDSGNAGNGALQAFTRISQVAIVNDTADLNTAGAGQDGYHRISYLAFNILY